MYQHKEKVWHHHHNNEIIIIIIIIIKMEYDPYSTLMINPSNCILIVVHLYCCTKLNLLSVIVIAHALSPAHFVMVTFWFKKVIQVFLQKRIKWDTVNLHL